MDNAIANMSRKGYLYRVRGIFQAVAQNSVSATEIALLERLTEETFEFGGRKVGSYALAALHILRAKEYTGDEAEVIELIQTMPGFNID